ncbi:MAG: DNA methyltransferase [Betaproteobacteria bacterium]|nr:DNA methyltransferase [Betaproteobacteria bacterium]
MAERILLNCDCMDYMKDCEDNAFDLAIVDPEYGNESDATKTYTSNSKNRVTERKIYKQFKNIQPKPEYFTELMRISGKQIIWGVNFYKNVDLTGGRIVWDKIGTVFGRAEIAYYSHSRSVQIFQYEWNGMLQGNMKNKEYRIHPTQKPVKLYEWLLTNYAKEGDRILDTHLGSGSSAIAAHYGQFDFVGMEIDEDYYNAACKRFDDETAQLDLLAYNG